MIFLFFLSTKMFSLWSWCSVFITIYLGIDFFLHPAWDTLYFMLINGYYLFNYDLFPIFSMFSILAIWLVGCKIISFCFPFILTSHFYYPSPFSMFFFLGQFFYCTILLFIMYNLIFNPNFDILDNNFFISRRHYKHTWLF